MFGFLIASEVNDDAVRLKAVAEMAAKKYANLPFDDAKKAIESDFGEGLRYIGFDDCTFSYRELPEFLFSFGRDLGEVPRTLTIFGRGKYAGFMFQSHKGGDTWHCSVSDGIRYRATGGAKKLAQIMEKKFGFRDFSKMLREF